MRNVTNLPVYFRLLPLRANMGNTYSYPGGFTSLNVHPPTLGGAIGMVLVLGLVVGLTIWANKFYRSKRNRSYGQRYFSLKCNFFNFFRNSKGQLPLYQQPPASLQQGGGWTHRYYPALPQERTAASVPGRLVESPDQTGWDSTKVNEISY